MSRGSKFRIEWAPYASEYLGTNELPSAVTIDGEVGSGGEAVIYSVREIPNALIKLYRTNDPKELLFREEKVRAMIKAKPQEPTPGHITFAWPLGMVYDRRGRFRGFVMPYIRCAVPISNFFYLDDYSWMDKFRNCGVPEDRLDAIKNNIELFRVGVALNLVKAVGYLHAVGHFVGDLNDRNVLVNSDGLVTLIDADSFFIRDPDTGRTYPSEVGVGEYTAPEVLRGLILPDRRSEGTDVFSLSVIIFKLLMNGYHPFAGTVPSREGNTIEDNIRDCLSPYFGKGRRKVRKPIGTPDINSLPPELTNLFERVFQSCDGSGRPSIEEFLRVLENYYYRIRQSIYQLNVKRRILTSSSSSRPSSPQSSLLLNKKYIRFSSTLGLIGLILGLITSLLLKSLTITQWIPKIPDVSTTILNLAALFSLLYGNSSVLITLHKLSKVYGNRNIWTNALYSLVIAAVGSIALVLIAYLIYTMLLVSIDSKIIIIIILIFFLTLFYIIILISVKFMRNAYNELSKSSGIIDFNLAARWYWLGAILFIVGLALMIVATIYAILGYNKLRKLA